MIELTPRGRKMQRALDRLNLSLTDVAARVGVRDVTVWRWMRQDGRIHRNHLRRLEVALNMKGQLNGN